MSFADFKIRLAKSTVTVWNLAQQLNYEGYPVQIPASKTAPTPEEWMHYVDNGDLFITLRLEVKQSKLVFSCADDYIHPEFMVCNRDACNRAVPPIAAVLIVSKDQKHVAVIRKETRPVWYELKKYDREKNRMEWFYFCPKSAVEWWEYKHLMGLF